MCVVCVDVYVLRLVGWRYSVVCFFFFKQKTAYEMRISDWSSDVCSSDLVIGVQDEQQIQCLGRHRVELQRLGWHLEHHVQEAIDVIEVEIGRASCRERVCQYV